MEPGSHVGLAAAAGLVLLAYLVGSVPFAFLLGRLRGVDLRKVGSGNIGATNLARVGGARWGVPAFLLDFLKGLAPVLLAGAAGGDPIEGAAIEGRGALAAHVQIACALAAVLGHVFPVYLGFRGGKGVATSFGALAGLSWEAALAAGLVWLVLFLWTRTVSIASIGAALAFPIATVLVFRSHPREVALPMDLLAALVAALIVVRHRSNIRRLLLGREARF